MRDSPNLWFSKFLGPRSWTKVPVEWKVEFLINNENKLSTLFIEMYTQGVHFYEWDKWINRTQQKADDARSLCCCYLALTLTARQIRHKVHRYKVVWSLLYQHKKHGRFYRGFIAFYKSNSCSSEPLLNQNFNLEFA